MEDRSLIIFAKAPVHGQVKTRLNPVYSQHQSVIIHQQLLEYTISRLKKVQNVDVQLHCAPNSRHNFFQYLKAQYRTDLYDQAEGDLGEKMSSAMTQALCHYKKVVLIGSDCPAMKAEYVEQAFRKLDRHSVVLGPAEDGGYVLVGLNEANPEVFNTIDWGTEKVLQQTIDKILPDIPMLLDTLWDVDRPEDVLRFREMIK